MKFSSLSDHHLLIKQSSNWKRIIGIYGYSISDAIYNTKICRSDCRRIFIYSLKRDPTPLSLLTKPNDSLRYPVDPTRICTMRSCISRLSRNRLGVEKSKAMVRIDAWRRAMQRARRCPAWIRVPRKNAQFYGTCSHRAYLRARPSRERVYLGTHVFHASAESACL